MKKHLKTKGPKAASTMAAAPDLRKTFEAVSRQMMAEFERTRSTGHAGGRGANREEIVRAFLCHYLPKRYGVGTGQLVHWSNLQSCQCDVVIYDGFETPRLMPDENHSLFPAEAVHGVIEVKSQLTATEFKRAIHGLRSAFRVARDPDPWDGMGNWLGERGQGPFTAILAFASERSLEAIRDQLVAEWPVGPGRVPQPPPLVAVLGKGTIEGSFWPGTLDRDSLRLRHTKELTLLRFYMGLLSHLGNSALPKFMFERYLSMPQVFENHRVRQNLRAFEFGGAGSRFRLSSAGLRKILEHCKGSQPVPYFEFLRTRLGFADGGPWGTSGNKPTFEFNPSQRDLTVNRHNGHKGAGSLSLITIDGNNYVADFDAFTKTDFEPVDPALEELF